ncbi:cytochrome P460 family protein [Mesorhizobium sp. CA13]|uniref:cytochrome P460 family protein n=1 Tax=Mesorhizobium sp. CA13 TaxID=2876643 RepID=UPI001CC9AE10|nr:cytochrome P460 family protein [Mesorhizobium sp. CA13]MBZ9856383.1 cytochrome P460 family protein [Mesorhizobium sp. CA13]
MPPTAAKARRKCTPSTRPRGAIDTYRKTGHFPDGTVLVKEVLATSTNEMTTGTVSYTDRLKGWFVMVKDSKETFPATRCGATGGDGRGSTRTSRSRLARPNDHTDCQGCHVPAKVTDWIYVNGYPVLRH